MESEGGLAGNKTIDFSWPDAAQDECSLQARTQAFEEAVALTLFASAWLRHSRKDPRASRTTRLIAQLLAASSGTATLPGAEPFAAARKFLEEANG